MGKRIAWQDRERIRQIEALPWSIERLERRRGTVLAGSEQERRLALEIDDRQHHVTRLQQQYERPER